MRCTLTVCGVDYGEIEVGENSLVALLARGKIAPAMRQIAAMQEEINSISRLTRAQPDRAGSVDGGEETLTRPAG
jgi:hypothetical protein